MVNEMLVVFLGGLTFSCLHLCSARCECEVVTVVCVLYYVMLLLSGGVCLSFFFLFLLRY